jgi:hypothetical protein
MRVARTPVYEGEIPPARVQEITGKAATVSIEIIKLGSSGYFETPSPQRPDARRLPSENSRVLFPATLPSFCRSNPLGGPHQGETQGTDTFTHSLPAVCEIHDDCVELFLGRAAWRRASGNRPAAPERGLRRERMLSAQWRATISLRNRIPSPTFMETDRWVGTS